MRSGLLGLGAAVIAAALPDAGTPARPAPVGPAGQSIEQGAPPARSRFRTRPARSALPGDRSCARRLRRSSWEPRPGNRRANRTRGSALVMPADAWEHFPSWHRLARRVNGAFTGTTDEILQWASCKWGFDDNVTRAQAYVESHWHQSFVGDDGQSVGLLQVKSAREGTPHRYTWPLSRSSTAYNVDYALAWRRACFDGLFIEGGWLPTSSRGDLWGCIGLWYSGDWHEGDGRYVADVRRALRARPWRSWSDR